MVRGQPRHSLITKVKMLLVRQMLLQIQHQYYLMVTYILILWKTVRLHRLIKYLSLEDQEAIGRAEASGNWEDPGYLRANEHYFEKFVISVDENSPECLRRPKRAGTEAYLYGWGPNEYQPLGDLAGFEYTDRLGEIRQPCLICSGTRDICTPVVAASLYENIPHSRWEVFKGARHTCFVEQTEKYCAILEKWLDEVEH